MVETKILKVIKRDGREVDFNFNKISDSIFEAAQSVGGSDRKKAKLLADEVVALLEEESKSDIVPVERIQNLVENVLIKNDHAKTAKEFILYCHKKNEEKKRRALILGNKRSNDNLTFSNEALRILEKRYLLKDELGNLSETPKQALERVARSVAEAEKLYGGNKEQIQKLADQFYQIMAELLFLPNSPTLINAGTKIQQLSSCFVLPIEDKMESIFGTLHDAAVIHQRGSGTGFSFSRLRQRGDLVGRHLGVAAGPIEFMKVYDRALETIKQGGIRPGANMAVLRVDHPEIMRFIESKRNKRIMKSFNISVAVTDRFMKAVEEDREYFIKNPRLGRYMGKLRARDIFAVITQNAWKTGDPGLIFIDEINRRHPAKHLGEIETTNQCGEVPLLPYESIGLGAVNLLSFVDLQNKDLNWQKLQDTVHLAVHFLDNMIDVNHYPQKKVAEISKKTRKFGLGIMGFADMLCALQIKYDSNAGLEMGDKILTFIRNAAYDKSILLAKEKGVCPAWEGSDHQKTGRKMRNITCISISPTGTRSILAGASPGCEPLFGISYYSTVLGGNAIIHTNKIFEKVAKERGFYSPELMRNVARAGSIQNLKEIPKDVRDVFVTAQDISPEWHVKMQATLQKHVDNSISKTINFPRTAAIRDVEEAYLLAWKMKCKGITIYRDGSYEDQVMTIGES